MDKYLNPNDIMVRLKCDVCGHMKTVRLNRLMELMGFCEKCNYVGGFMKIDRVRYVKYVESST